ncbi:MAG: rod shape-determining protein RodA [Spirochaetae bacterium HGW-Spirochaetae-5]|nr:MAG: rod shape-determining protein RodA [Spirochaetae bacterium HGW-Spirochaetae-5]
MFNRDFFNRMDIVLIGAVFLAITFGILMIYSAGFDPAIAANKGLYKKQIIWFIMGIIFMVVMSIINYRVLGDYALYIYGFLLFILLVTTIFGRPIRGSSSWLTFGFFSIQPSEFMKLGMVILLAKYLELRERDIKNFKELLVPSLIVLIPVLIILKQPDLGTAAIFIPVLFTMLFLGGSDVSHLVSIILIAGIAFLFPMLLTYWEWSGYKGGNFIVELFVHVDVLFTVAGILLLIAITTFITHYFVNKSFLRKIYIPTAVISLGLLLSVVIQNWFKVYQKKRILVFLNPDLDPHGSGYNIIQSKVAIGSGGFFGKGFLQGTQTQLGFLPEKTSDFIFAVVAEELGFAGALLLLFILGLIIYRGIRISLDTRDKFGAMLAIGIVSILFFHVFINIGMVIGIMPVTGLPLSFFSYGGSNLFMIMMGIGILNNIKMNKSSY